MLLAFSAQIFDKSPAKVKNFGIWFRYESRTGTHNSYKEYRELTLTDAVAAMYDDMAGRSRPRPLPAGSRTPPGLSGPPVAASRGGRPFRQPADRTRPASCR